MVLGPFGIMSYKSTSYRAVGPSCRGVDAGVAPIWNHELRVAQGIFLPEVMWFAGLPECVRAPCASLGKDALITFSGSHTEFTQNSPK